MTDIFLGRILGIPFRIHWSWFLAVLLISWTLATNILPMVLPAYAGSTAWFWGLGLLSALGLFFSLVLHELGHAVVALRCGVPVRGIRLFVFGGVAELGSDPRKASHEFFIAVGGPLVTVFLIIFYGVFLHFFMSFTGVEDGAEHLVLQGGNSVTVGVSAIVRFLFFANIMVLVFNMIPAFPLDGGRVLRGILWAFTGSYLTSTRIAATIGIGFSWLLFLGGALKLIFSQDIVGGIWLFFLGMFLQNAAGSSIAYAQTRQLLRNVRVGDLMRRDPVTLPANCTLQEAVDEYFLRHPHKVYPVVQDGSFVGLLPLRWIQEIERAEWPHMLVRDLFLPDDPPQVQLKPEEPAFDGLRKCAETGLSRLPVVEEGHLIGLLCRRDIMNYIEIESGLAKRQ